LNRFKQVVGSFDHAMLVTRTGASELRCRPMQIAGMDDRGHVWFLSSIDSGKIEEITEFPYISVALQDGKRFVSVSGVVRVTRDPDAVREFWTESQRVWFERGRHDPELVLLEVIPTRAEYWDRSGIDGLKFLLVEARALLAGDTLSGAEARHEKIEFPDTSA
jgi:general stress protein 26